MKKWWFSIVCYVVACILIIYPIVGAWFLDDEVWFMTTQIISVLSSSLLLIIIGLANQPQKKRRKNQMSKKKIKDLTLDDCEQVCFKQKECDKCPLVFSKKSPIHCLFIAIKCGYEPQGNMEKEVLL